MLIRHFSHSPFKFSSQEVFHNKGLPEKIAKLTESVDGGVSFSIKLKVEKKLRFMCIHVNFAKFLRTTICLQMWEMPLLLSWDIPT